MALCYSGIQMEIREVSLKDKPAAMLQISPKGTVPVLDLRDGTVIDESLSVMHWALLQHDPQDWLMSSQPTLQQEAAELIATNDGAFKQALDRYKYAIRFPEQPPAVYRAEGERFLAQLERRLNAQAFLCRDQSSVADAAIFPFIRQFALVDEAWFAQTPYPALRQWLRQWLESELFLKVMEKAPA